MIVGEISLWIFYCVKRIFAIGISFLELFRSFLYREGALESLRGLLWDYNRIMIDGMLLLRYNVSKIVDNFYYVCDFFISKVDSR